MTRVLLTRRPDGFSLEARGHSSGTASCNYITGVLYALAGWCHAAAARGEAEVLRFEAHEGAMLLSVRGAGEKISAVLEAAEIGLRQLEASEARALRVTLRGSR